MIKFEIQKLYILRRLQMEENHMKIESNKWLKTIVLLAVVIIKAQNYFEKKQCQLNNKNITKGAT